MLDYIKKFIDATDPTVSLQHFAYALVICMSCLWLTYDLAKHGLSGSWVATYTLLTGAVTTAKIIGKPDGPGPTPGA